MQIPANVTPAIKQRTRQIPRFSIRDCKDENNQLSVFIATNSQFS